MNNAVYILGIILQGLGGLIALLQVRRAPRKLPWLLIAISALLIVYRRSATLGEFIRAERPLATAEIMTLLISLLFFAGVLLMSQMFREVIESRARLRKSEAELRSAIARLDRQLSEQAIVDAFTHSVSHDLRAPLRRVAGFSEALLEDYHEQLDQQGRDYLERIDNQIKAMDLLVVAMLDLSKITQHKLDYDQVDLVALAREHLDYLHLQEPERRYELVAEPNLVAAGDPTLLSTLLRKLVENAWSHTTFRETAVIELGRVTGEDETVFFLRDNGIGFNMEKVDQLFIPFKKLHSGDANPGLGIGLNIAHRIITRHGGEIWAEGKPGEGAVFYFTLNLPLSPGGSGHK